MKVGELLAKIMSMVNHDNGLLGKEIDVVVNDDQSVEILNVYQDAVGISLRVEI